MSVLLPYTYYLAAMLVLMGFSAFFSSSEAAFFCLDTADRKSLAAGGPLARLAERLIRAPERLLMAALLGNLIVNLLFFTLTSILLFQLQKSGHGAFGGVFSITMLVTLILFCEMLPKNLSVLTPRRVAMATALPLAWTIRLLSPLMPLLERMNVLSRRLFFPRFVSEPYLRIADIERAVELSKEDAALLQREQRVLRNIVAMSDMTVEEMMRPRPLLKTFRPPVRLETVLEQLADGEEATPTAGRPGSVSGQRYDSLLPRSGFLVITEAETDEIASVVPLYRLYGTDGRSAWGEHSEPVLYMPWSLSVADALEQFRTTAREAAAVINEYGETIGLLTRDDIFDTLFAREPSRERRLYRRAAIRKVGDNLWHVSGLTSLRQLVRQLGIVPPFHESVTVGGLLQEIFERLPRVGDECDWGPFTLRVLAIDDERCANVELRLNR